MEELAVLRTVTGVPGSKLAGGWRTETETREISEWEGTREMGDAHSTPHLTHACKREGG